MTAKKIIKLIAAILVPAFLAQDLAFAAPELKAADLAFFRPPLVNFQIPRSIALIEDTHQAPKHQRTLYLIQDAHTNESAQMNTAKALDLLLQKEKIKYVFLEAGTGNDSLSYLRDAAPQAKRERVAKSFVTQGELSGSEYLDLTSDRPFVLWGVEDKTLYWESLEVYKSVAAKREEFQDYLKKVESTIQTLKPKLFNPSLSFLDAKREAYLNEKIPLTDYFDALLSEASRFEIPLSYFPHLQSFKKLKEKEGEIDFAQANEEQVKLVGESGITPLKLSGGDHPEQQGFYALLEAVIARAEDPKQSSRYPELIKYIAYLKEAQKINPEKLLEEQKSLERQIIALLIQSQDEKDLHRSSETLRMLKKLFDLTLTPSEYEDYQKHSAGFDISEMTGFLNSKIMDIKDHYERVVFLEGGYEAYLKKAKRFYELTRERDSAFVRNVLQKMDQEGENKAVLVTGGYHSSNLKALLKEANISYVSVRPQVTHETNHKRYEKILLNQTPRDDARGPENLMAVRPIVHRFEPLGRLDQSLGVREKAFANGLAGVGAVERASRTPSLVYGKTGARLAADVAVRDTAAEVARIEQDIDYLFSLRNHVAKYAPSGPTRDRDMASLRQQIAKRQQEMNALRGAETEREKAPEFAVRPILRVLEGLSDRELDSFTRRGFPPVVPMLIPLFRFLERFPQTDVYFAWKQLLWQFRRPAHEKEITAALQKDKAEIVSAIRRDREAGRIGARLAAYESLSWASFFKTLGMWRATDNALELFPPDEKTALKGRVNAIVNQLVAGRIDLSKFLTTAMPALLDSHFTFSEITDVLSRVDDEIHIEFLTVTVTDPTERILDKVRHSAQAAEKKESVPQINWVEHFENSLPVIGKVLSERQFNALKNDALLVTTYQTFEGLVSRSSDREMKDYTIEFFRLFEARHVKKYRIVQRSMRSSGRSGARLAEEGELYPVTLKKKGDDRWIAESRKGKFHYEIGEVSAATPPGVIDQAKALLTSVLPEELSNRKGLPSFIDRVTKAIIAGSADYQLALLVDSEKGRTAGFYIYNTVSGRLRVMAVHPDYRGTGAVDILLEDIVTRVFFGHKDFRFKSTIWRQSARVDEKRRDFKGTVGEFRDAAGIKSRARVEPDFVGTDPGEEPTEIPTGARLAFNQLSHGRRASLLLDEADQALKEQNFEQTSQIVERALAILRAPGHEDMRVGIQMRAFNLLKEVKAAKARIMQAEIDAAKSGYNAPSSHGVNARRFLQRARVFFVNRELDPAPYLGVAKAWAELAMATAIEPGHDNTHVSVYLSAVDLVRQIKEEENLIQAEKRGDGARLAAERVLSPLDLTKLLEGALWPVMKEIIRQNGDQKPQTIVVSGNNVDEIIDQLKDSVWGAASAVSAGPDWVVASLRIHNAYYLLADTRQNIRHYIDMLSVSPRRALPSEVAFHVALNVDDKERKIYLDTENIAIGGAIRRSLRNVRNGNLAVVLLESTTHLLLEKCRGYSAVVAHQNPYARADFDKLAEQLKTEMTALPDKDQRLLQFSQIEAREGKDIAVLESSLLLAKTDASREKQARKYQQYRLWKRKKAIFEKYFEIKADPDGSGVFKGIVTPPVKERGDFQETFRLSGDVPVEVRVVGEHVVFQGKYAGEEYGIFDLKELPVVFNIGRVEDPEDGGAMNEVVVPYRSRGVSRRHARVIRNSDGTLDLEVAAAASNPVYVQGKKIAERTRLNVVLPKREDAPGLRANHAALPALTQPVAKKDQVLLGILRNYKGIFLTADPQKRAVARRVRDVMEKLLQIDKSFASQIKELGEIALLGKEYAALAYELSIILHYRLEDELESAEDEERRAFYESCNKLVSEFTPEKLFEGLSKKHKGLVKKSFLGDLAQRGLSYFTEPERRLVAAIVMAICAQDQPHRTAELVEKAKKILLGEEDPQWSMDIFYRFLDELEPYNAKRAEGKKEEAINTPFGRAHQYLDSELSNYEDVVKGLLSPHRRKKWELVLERRKREFEEMQRNANRLILGLKREDRLAPDNVLNQLMILEIIPRYNSLVLKCRDTGGEILYVKFDYRSGLAGDLARDKGKTLNLELHLRDAAFTHQVGNLEGMKGGLTPASLGVMSGSENETIDKILSAYLEGKPALRPKTLRELLAFKRSLKAQTGQMYILFEEGGDRNLELDPHTPPDKFVPASRYLETFIDALRTLSAAHENGVTHRDFGPSQVVWFESGKKPAGRSTKIIDWTQGVWTAFPEFLAETLHTNAREAMTRPWGYGIFYTTGDKGGDEDKDNYAVLIMLLKFLRYYRASLDKALGSFVTEETLIGNLKIRRLWDEVKDKSYDDFDAYLMDYGDLPIKLAAGQYSADPQKEGLPKAKESLTFLEALQKASGARLALVEEFKEILQGPDAHKRRQAVIKLVTEGTQAHVPLLIPVLHDPDPVMRQYAAINLGRINENRTGEGVDEAIVALEEAFKKESSENVKPFIVEALGKIGRAAVPVLRAIAENEAESALSRDTARSYLPGQGARLADQKVDLNLASKSELMDLFGKVALVDDRRRAALVDKVIQMRPYSSISELIRVKGIGKSTFAEIERVLGDRLIVSTLPKNENILPPRKEGRVTFFPIFHNTPQDFERHRSSLEEAKREAETQGKPFVIVHDFGGIDWMHPQHWADDVVDHAKKTNDKKLKAALRANFDFGMDDISKFARIIRQRQPLPKEEGANPYMSALGEWAIANHVQVIFEKPTYESWLLFIKSGAKLLRASKLFTSAFGYHNVSDRRKYMALMEEVLRDFSENIRIRNEGFVDLVRENASQGTAVAAIFGAAHLGVYDTLKEKGSDIVRSDSGEDQENFRKYGVLMALSGRTASGETVGSEEREFIFSRYPIISYLDALGNSIGRFDSIRRSEIAGKITMRFSDSEVEEFAKLYYMQDLEGPRRYVLDWLKRNGSEAEIRFFSGARLAQKRTDPADLKEALAFYYGLKQDMMHALDKDEFDAFNALHAEMSVLVEKARKFVVKAKDEELSAALGEAVKSSGAHPFLFAPAGTPEEAFIEVARKEIAGIGEKDFSPKMKRLIAVIVDEVVTELYDNPSEREAKRLEILADIQTPHFKNWLEPIDLSSPELSLKKARAGAGLMDISRSVGSAWGSVDPVRKKVFIQSYDDELVVRSTLKHELIHYLAAKGEIKIPVYWEQITYAVDVIERVRHAGKTLQEGEKLLPRYADEFAEPALAELYERGKEMGKSGNFGFVVRPGVSDKHASYFSIDALLAEARAVYEKKNLNADAFLVPYRAQQMAGILIGGILMGMTEKDPDLKPLAVLRDFFAVLHERYAPPDASEIQWVTGKDGLRAELKKYATYLAGQNVEMIPVDSGLWHYRFVTDRSGEVRYVVTDLYPRPYDGAAIADPAQKKKIQREAARERGLGQTVLAVSKFKDGRSEVAEAKLPDLFSKRPFQALWDTLLMPHVVSKIFSSRGRIESLAAGKDFSGAPAWIARVLSDRYDIGNKLVEESLLASLPIHLQYLDTLIYRWAKFDPNTMALNDPRVRDARVGKAMAATAPAWEKIMFDLKPGSLTDDKRDDELARTVKDMVWPAYLALFDEAVKEEERRRAYERMIKEDAERQFAPFDQLTEEQKQALEDYWNKLPQDVKDAIQQAAQQMMDQAMDQFQQAMAGSPQGGAGAPMPGGGKSGKPSGQKGQASAQGVGEQLGQIEKAVETLSKEIQSMASQLHGLQEESQKASQTAKGVQGAKEGRPEQARQIQNQAATIQNAANELLDHGRDVESQAKGQAEGSQSLKEGLASPEQGADLENKSGTMAQQAKELLDKLSKLQELANQLKKQADKLAGTAAEPKPDDPAVSAQAQAASQSAQDMVQQTEGVEGSVRSLKDLIAKVQKEVDKLKESLGNQKSQGPAKGQSAGAAKGAAESQEGSESGEAGESSEGGAGLGQGGGSGFGKGSAGQLTAQIKGGEGLDQLIEKFSQKDQEEEAAKKSEAAKPDAHFDKDDYEQMKKFEQIKPLYKNEWLRALANKSELDLGNLKLTDAQREEYHQMRREIQPLIDDMTKALRALTIPSTGMKLERDLELGPILDHPVKAVIGEKGFARREDEEPLPVKISFLIDKSGSMGGEPIRYARLTMLLFLEVIFNLNEELRHGGFKPIEFEVGLFTDNDSLQISHEDSADLQDHEREALIYLVLEGITPTGGTNYSESLGRYVARLVEASDHSAEKSRRLFFAISDEEVSEDMHEEVRRIIRYAEENNVAVFPIPVGSQRQIENSVRLHDPDRVIVVNPISKLPQKMMEAFAQYLVPPASGRSWTDTLGARLAGKHTPAADEIARLIADEIDQIEFDDILKGEYGEEIAVIIKDIFSKHMPSVGLFGPIRSEGGIMGEMMSLNKKGEWKIFYEHTDGSKSLLASPVYEEKWKPIGKYMKDQNAAKVEDGPDSQEIFINVNSDGIAEVVTALLREASSKPEPVAPSVVLEPTGPAQEAKRLKKFRDSLSVSNFPESVRKALLEAGVTTAALNDLVAEKEHEAKTGKKPAAEEVTEHNVKMLKAIGLVGDEKDGPVTAFGFADLEGRILSWQSSVGDAPFRGQKNGVLAFKLVSKKSGGLRLYRVEEFIRRPKDMRNNRYLSDERLERVEDLIQRAIQLVNGARLADEAQMKSIAAVIESAIAKSGTSIYLNGNWGEQVRRQVEEDFIRFAPWFSDTGAKILLVEDESSPTGTGYDVKWSIFLEFPDSKKVTLAQLNLKYHVTAGVSSSSDYHIPSESNFQFFKENCVQALDQLFSTQFGNTAESVLPKPAHAKAGLERFRDSLNKSSLDPRVLQALTNEGVHEMVDAKIEEAKVEAEKEQAASKAAEESRKKDLADAVHADPERVAIAIREKLDSITDTHGREPKNVAGIIDKEAIAAEEDRQRTIRDIAQEIFSAYLTHETYQGPPFMSSASDYEGFPVDIELNGEGVVILSFNKENDPELEEVWGPGWKCEIKLRAPAGFTEETKDLFIQHHIGDLLPVIPSPEQAREKAKGEPFWRYIEKEPGKGNTLDVMYGGPQMQPFYVYKDIHPGDTSFDPDIHKFDEQLYADFNKWHNDQLKKEARDASGGKHGTRLASGGTVETIYKNILSHFKGVMVVPVSGADETIINAVLGAFKTEFPDADLTLFALVGYDTVSWGGKVILHMQYDGGAPDYYDIEPFLKEEILREAIAYYLGIPSPATASPQPTAESSPEVDAVKEGLQRFRDVLDDPSLDPGVRKALAEAGIAEIVDAKIQEAQAEAEKEQAALKAAEEAWKKILSEPIHSDPERVADAIYKKLPLVEHRTEAIKNLGLEEKWRQVILNTSKKICDAYATHNIYQEQIILPWIPDNDAFEIDIFYNNKGVITVSSHQDPVPNWDPAVDSHGWRFYIDLRPAGARLAKTSSPNALVGDQAVIESLKQEFDPVEKTPYKNFYIAEKGGRSFLVFDDGARPRLQFERGAGGRHVPDTDVPDVAYNEELILRILMESYPQNFAYSSYTPDGSFMIRYGEGETVELRGRSPEGEWMTIKAFGAGSRPVVEGGVARNEAGLKWKVQDNQLLISQKNSDFRPADGVSASTSLVLHEQTPDRIFAFHPQVRAVSILEKISGNWTARQTLFFERPLKEVWEPRIVELEGETGLGKGTILRAAAKLMNEEIFFIAGHKDMTIEELSQYTVLGLKESGRSGALASILSQVSHDGGWVVLDEIHKIPKKALDSQKATVAGNQHSWRIHAPDGTERDGYLFNSPRARIFATSNTLRPGIASSGAGYEIYDPAMQRRQMVVHVTWLPKNQEAQMQFEYANGEAVEQGLYKHYAGRPEELKAKLRKTIESLVNIAAMQRLLFSGYSLNQIKQIDKDWSLLDDPAAFPTANNPAQQIKRAPSPRVLKTILRHMVTYPKDWELRPWSAIELYHNFYADLDKQNTYQNVRTQFEENGFKDTDHGPLVLEESSFTVRGDMLVVTPSGDKWDTVELPIHPDASIRRGQLPREIKEWLKSAANHKILYRALQGLALGRHLIFVGEPGTGKSMLARAIQVLTSGEDLLMKPISYQTGKEDMTFAHRLGEAGAKPFQSVFLEREIPRAMNDGKGYGRGLIMEETQLGRQALIGLLNDVSERGYLLTPAGSPIDAGRGFYIIHCINPPGKDFEPLSDEFLERHMILYFPPLQPEAMMPYLVDAGKTDKLQVNPRFIEGLVGALKTIRAKMDEAKRNNAKYLPRVPELGSLKRFIQSLINYFTFRRQDASGKPRVYQDLLLKIFLQAFTVRGKASQVQEWRAAIQAAFAENGLFSKKAGEDAVRTFLQGEDVIMPFEDLGVVREPRTGEDEFDNALRRLQRTVFESSALFHIDLFRKLMEEAGKEERWDAIEPFYERLEAIGGFKEIYQVLAVVLAERPQHTMKAKTAMEHVRTKIKAVLEERHWPAYLLDSPDTVKDWIAKVPSPSDTKNPALDESINKMNLFASDAAFVKEEAKLLKEHLAQVSSKSKPAGKSKSAARLATEPDPNEVSQIVDLIVKDMPEKMSPGSYGPGLKDLGEEITNALKDSFLRHLPAGVSKISIKKEGEQMPTGVGVYYGYWDVFYVHPDGKKTILARPTLNEQYNLDTLAKQEALATVYREGIEEVVSALLSLVPSALPDQGQTKEGLERFRKVLDDPSLDPAVRKALEEQGIAEIVDAKILEARREREREAERERANKAKGTQATPRKLGPATPISNASFSTRVFNLINKINSNIITLEDLAQAREEDLSKWPGMGPQGLAEVRKKLAEAGLSLDSKGAAGILVEDIDFGVVIRKTLNRNGIKTLGELEYLKEDVLLGTKLFGPAALARLKETLVKYGLHLGAKGARLAAESDPEEVSRISALIIKDVKATGMVDDYTQGWGRRVEVSLEESFARRMPAGASLGTLVREGSYLPVADGEIMGRWEIFHLTPGGKIILLAAPTEDMERSFSAKGNHRYSAEVKSEGITAAVRFLLETIPSAPSPDPGSIKGRLETFRKELDRPDLDPAVREALAKEGIADIVDAKIEEGSVQDTMDSVVERDPDEPVILHNLEMIKRFGSKGITDKGKMVEYGLIDAGGGILEWHAPVSRSSFEMEPKNVIAAKFERSEQPSGKMIYAIEGWMWPQSYGLSQPALDKSQFDQVKNIILKTLGRLNGARLASGSDTQAKLERFEKAIQDSKLDPNVRKALQTEGVYGAVKDRLRAVRAEKTGVPAAAPVPQAAQHPNLTAFTVKLFYAQSNEAGNPFALNYEDVTRILRIEPIKEGKDVKALVLLIKGAGTERPILTVKYPRAYLEELQRRGETSVTVTARDVISALTLSELNTAISMPAVTSQAPIVYGINVPLTHFGKIKDPQAFNAQLGLLVSQAAKHRKAALKQNKQAEIFLSEADLLVNWQRDLLKTAARSFPSFIKAGEPEKTFKGAVIMLWDARSTPGAPSNDGKTFYVSIGELGAEGQDVVSWVRAFSIANWIGSRYDYDPKTGTVDLDEVKPADQELQKVLAFFNTHLEDRTDSVSAELFLRLITGRGDSKDYLKYVLELPILRKIPLNIIIQGARLALRAVGVAA